MEFCKVSKSYGSLKLFDNFDFKLTASEVTCLLGPSGCGKTTLLDMAAGLEPADTGEVLRPEMIAYVFQEPRLLPWLTVAENALYAMDPKTPVATRDHQLSNMLVQMELQDAADKFPDEVSGGMARRCALARALLAPSDLVLLDEPLSSLDPDMRSRILGRLPELLAGRTTVLVTHDYGVASLLSDSIYMLSEPPVEIETVGAKDLETVLQQIEDRD